MRGILINMYQLVPPKQRELRAKITVREPGKDRQGGSSKCGNKRRVPLNSTTQELFFLNLVLTVRGDNDKRCDERARLTRAP